MKAHVLLADSAQGEKGTTKVHALGLGWNTTTTPTPPAAVVVLIQVPWDQTNQRHHLRVTLIDSDGRPPMLGKDSEGNPAPVMIEQNFEVGRPAGVPAGFSIDHSLAVNLGSGLRLKPGEIYEWRLEIDEVHEEDWSAKFLVRQR